MSMGSQHTKIVNGNSIAYLNNSREAPTVVFESGLGDGLSVWKKVYNEVQVFAGTFAYSRPGYSPGFHKAGIKGKRTAADSAKLLQQILAKTGAPAPYILVGHSIGGLYILEFARHYPDLVAGLVLVDGRLPEFSKRCETEGIKPCKPPAWALLLSPPHMAAEIRGIASSEANAPTPADIGEIPVILLAATKPPPGGSAKSQPIWLEVQRNFAAALPNAELIIAEGSGHYIQRDAPQLVIQAIRDLINKIGSN